MNTNITSIHSSLQLYQSLYKYKHVHASIRAYIRIVITTNFCVKFYLDEGRLRWFLYTGRITWAARSITASRRLDSRVTAQFTVIQCCLLYDRPALNGHILRTGSHILSSCPAPCIVCIRWPGVYGWTLVF